MIPRFVVMDVPNTPYLLIGTNVSKTTYLESDPNAKNAFVDKSEAVGDIIIPQKINGKYVTDIGVCAFYWCKDLTSIEIRAPIVRIHYFAFGYCYGLKQLIIPPTLMQTSRAAFNCNHLEEIVIQGSYIKYFVGKGPFE